MRELLCPPDPLLSKFLYLGLQRLQEPLLPVLANCMMDVLYALELSKVMARKSSGSIKDFDQISKINVMIPVQMWNQAARCNMLPPYRNGGWSRTLAKIFIEI